MTQPQPPQLPPMAPFNPTPTQQHVLVEEETATDGTKLLKILIIQPCTTTMLILGQESARTLADQLFQRANGLQIVRDVPPGGMSA